ncbi:MAG: hypothetical protein ACD_81C00023G0002 [uncultured bacterium]|nr:MAG: hypothetical protein ACD_81C00023G0002 [uncultured bacterium]
MLVNGKKVTIPSYSVTAESVISLKSKALEIPAVKKMIDEKTFTPPEWISRQGPVGKVDRVPVRTDVKEDITEQFIVEHYSR